MLASPKMLCGPVISSKSHGTSTLVRIYDVGHEQVLQLYAGLQYWQGGNTHV